MAARGLRQAVGLVLVAALVAALLGGAWQLVAGDGFARVCGLALIAVGGLLGLTGSRDSSRAGTADLRAWLGSPTERGPQTDDGALTAAGIFVFVSLPLVALGFVLLGTG